MLFHDGGIGYFLTAKIQQLIGLIGCAGVQFLLAVVYYADFVSFKQHFFYPFFGLVDVGCGENKGNVASVECLLLGWLGMNVGVHLYCVASLGFGEYGIEESRPDSLSK